MASAAAHCLSNSHLGRGRRGAWRSDGCAAEPIEIDDIARPSRHCSSNSVLSMRSSRMVSARPLDAHRASAASRTMRSSVELESFQQGGHRGPCAWTDLSERLAYRQEGRPTVTIEQPRQSPGCARDVRAPRELPQLRRGPRLHLVGGIRLNNAEHAFKMLVRRRSQRLQGMTCGPPHIRFRIVERGQNHLCAAAIRDGPSGKPLPIPWRARLPMAWRADARLEVDPMEAVSIKRLRVASLWSARKPKAKAALARTASDGSSSLASNPFATARCGHRRFRRSARACSRRAAAPARTDD